MEDDDDDAVQVLHFHTGKAPDCSIFYEKGLQVYSASYSYSERTSDLTHFGPAVSFIINFPETKEFSSKRKIPRNGGRNESPSDKVGDY